MFRHRVSILGYVLCGIGLPVVIGTGILMQWFGTHFDMSETVFAANLVSTLGTMMLVCGLAMVICGVIARGFERVEAAVLSRRI